MQASSPFSPQNNHTVVLQPRGVRAPQSQLHGSEQRYLHDSENGISKRRTNNYHTPSRYYQENSKIRNTQPKLPHSDFNSNTDLLVRFGIDSIFGRVVTRILIALLLSQPVYVAMGMELEEVQTSDIESSQQTQTSSSSEEISNEQSSPVIDTAEETSPVTLPEVVTTKSSNTSVQTATVLQNGVAVEDKHVAQGNSETDSQNESLLEDDVVSDAEDLNTEDTDTSGGETVLDEGNTDADDTQNSSDIEGEETEDGTEVGTDTSEITEETEMVDGEEVESDVVNASQNSGNKYIFGEGDCTLVSDGEFYCVAESPTRQTTADPRVYSEKDREGDREIYYFDGVEVQRITNNSYDDFAPVFDEETLRIIWQAMLNDRLQIMMYEIPTNTTRQITSSRQNSSNPSIVGDTVVWQEWVDTNWEIMMTDVDNGGQEFEIEQITDNAVHDMFPILYDDLITWQREKGASWEVVVYDLRSKKSHILEKDEDTKFENPRFVLLFDSKHDNGDIETIGYDLDTGEKMELGTRANPQPIIPASPKDEAPDAVPREEKNEVEVVVVNDVEGNGDDGNLDIPDSGTDTYIDEEIVDDVQVDTQSVTTPLVLGDVIELAPLE